MSLSITGLADGRTVIATGHLVPPTTGLVELHEPFWELRAASLCTLSATTGATR